MRKADLQVGMMIWYTLHIEFDERIIQTSTVRVWMEWSLFDFHMY